MGVVGAARILVADDDPAVLQTITWILKEHGYDVSSAQGGRRSSSSWRRGAPTSCCSTS